MDVTETTDELHTWTLQDRGYDCDDLDQPRYDCTAQTLLDAIRMLDGFRSARHVEPINDIPGCSTLAVYAPAPRGAGADWSKIGVVYVANGPF